jgi:hypothetical protein
MTCFANGYPLDGAGCTPYYTLAYKTSNGTLLTGVPTTINFHVKEAENPAGFFNLATDIATVPFDGQYTVTFTIELILAASGLAYAAIEINTVGYAIDSVDAIAAGAINMCPSITRWMTAGDQIRCRAQQNSGFNATIVGAARDTNCGITSADIP